MEALLTTPLQASPFALLSGLAVAWALNIVKSPEWSKEVKLGLPIALSLLVGLADAWLRGQLGTADIFGSALTAIGAAQTFYAANFLQGLRERRSESALPVVNAVE